MPKRYEGWCEETETEIVAYAPNGKEYRIPKDSVRGKNECMMLCPEEKVLTGKYCNSKEYSHFLGVCEKGPNQLIHCYGFPVIGIWDSTFTHSWYTRNDFCQMCHGCPHAVEKADGFDPFYRSIFDANYLFATFHNHIDFRNEHPACFVYFISDGQYVKIGKAKNVKSRAKTMQTSNPRKLNILWVIPAKSDRDAYKIESSLHMIYKKYSLYGEWFDILDKIDKDSFGSLFSNNDYNETMEDET